MRKERLLSGIPGLETILKGGLLRGRTYLIVGAAGTGKTIFSLQFLREGLRYGDKCLYLTLAESAQDLARNVASLGWSLDGLEILDLSPITREAGPREYRVFAPAQVEEPALWQRIYESIETSQPQRLVIDPISIIRCLSPDAYQFRKNILSLVSYLNSLGCTSLLLAEPTEIAEETSLSLAVDGVIRLIRQIGQSRVIEFRYLSVEKMRGSDFLSGFHPYRITSQGFEIYPHLIFSLQEAQVTGSQISSGVPNLDELLGGGIEVGTSTVISGPAGVGKSTLGLSFMTNAVKMGQRALILTFEESPPSLIHRGQAIGLPLKSQLKKGQIKIIYVNPLTLYPDEFLGLIKKEVDREKRNIVMIDSVKGYNICMDAYGDLAAHTHNLAAFLQSQGITSFWINEVERITGELSLTELGISYLFDNAILMRYAEMGIQLIRLIGCLKKRLGVFQSELREFRITPKGLWVGEKLKGLTGLLSGMPRRWEQS